MNRFKDALLDELDEAMQAPRELDHAALQRAGLRHRRGRTAFRGGVVVAATAVVVLGAVAVAGDVAGPTVDVAGTPEQSTRTERSRATTGSSWPTEMPSVSRDVACESLDPDGVPGSECAPFVIIPALERIEEDGPDHARAAVRDGAVTEDEMETAARVAEQCARASGEAEVTVFLDDFGPLTGMAMDIRYDRDVSDERQETLSEIADECFLTHTDALNAIWQAQQFQATDN